MKLARHCIWSVLGLALMVAAPELAVAQPGPGDLAIAKGEQALVAFERREWEQALTSFREADALYHSPVFTLYQARALKELARLTEAVALLKKASDELLPEGAPESWLRAKSDAASELHELVKELPRLIVRVRNAVAPTATLDGRAVALGVSVNADPGEHQVIATDGKRTLSKRVTLRIGSETVADLELPAAPLPPSSTPPARNDSWLAAGITLASVGGAGLIAGAIFGGIALDHSATAEAALPPSCTADKACPTRDERAIEAGFQGAYDFAHASDGAFIAGGVLAAAGIVILIVDRTGAAGGHVTTQGGRLGIRF